MTTNTASTTKTASTRSGSRLLRSVATLGVAAATMALSFSGAWFSDTDAVSASSVTTGTLEMTAPATIDFSLTNMAPGDEANETVALRNNGSLQLRYDMSTTATNADAKGLAAQISAIVYQESLETTADGVCDASYATASGFTSLASGPLGSLSIDDRVVNATTDEVLCVAVQLPGASTGNEFQNATTTVTFTFVSEQTANNPVA